MRQWFFVRQWAWRAMVVAMAAAGCLSALRPAQAARNVILMVADGAGFNTWLAASMYRGRVGHEVYNAEGWVSLGCCTYPLHLAKAARGKGEQDPGLVYDPAKAWDSNRPSKLLAGAPFAGYVYLKATATDSAAAATAMATGQKSYNAAINWTDFDQPLTGRTLPELAAAAGKLAGVITSVPISHATPAGLGGAHNPSRQNYAEIANEMLAAAWLQVIMGAGHPEYDDRGQPRRLLKDYEYIGGEATWRQLKAGTHPGGWTLVESKAQFEALASGPTPAKVLGLARVASTLQQKRPRQADGDEVQPFADPFNADVPSLELMTRAALNCLDDDCDGFYLMIEGGAVDWANHVNDPARMVEEQIDFLRAVEAVVAWVESHGGWSETLVILTADHECGLVWGPKADEVAFQPLEDRGPGKLPGMRHLSLAHTNSLVPLFARGPGAERFAGLIIGTDERAAQTWHFCGRYVDNTAIFRLIAAELAAKAEP